MASTPDIMAEDAEITDGAGIATTPTTGGTYAPGATGGVIVSDASIGAGQPGNGQVITGGNTTGGQITGGLDAVTIGNAGAGGAAGSSVLPGSNASAPSDPNAVDPGVTSGGPTGGGRAVPDADVLQNSGPLGGSDSLDDDGPEGAAAIGNQTAGDATAGAPNAPGTSQDAVTHGDDAGIELDDTVHGDNDGVPTGGLVGGMGTSGP